MKSLMLRKKQQHRPKLQVPQVQFIGGGSEIGVRLVLGGVGGAQSYFKRFKRTFKVQSGGGTTITSVKYTVDLMLRAQMVHYFIIIEC